MIAREKTASTYVNSGLMRDVSSITYAGVATARRRNFQTLPVSNKCESHAVETYDLKRGDEEHVQQEERNATDILLDDQPPVVLAAHLITSSSPVVVCEP